MNKKKKYSKRTEEEYGFPGAHLIYFYGDKYRNRISISQDNNSEQIYIKVFTGANKFSLGVIDPPIKSPCGHLAIYFEDYEEMLARLKGKCAKRKFIRIIRDLVVLGYKIGDYMKDGHILWEKLWNITEAKN